MPRRRAIPKLEDAKLATLSASTRATISRNGVSLFRSQSVFSMSDLEAEKLAVAIVVSNPERFSGVLRLESPEPAPP